MRGCLCSQSNLQNHPTYHELQVSNITGTSPAGFSIHKGGIGSRNGSKCLPSVRKKGDCQRRVTDWSSASIFPPCSLEYSICVTSLSLWPYLHTNLLGDKRQRRETRGRIVSRENSMPSVFSRRIRSILHPFQDTGLLALQGWAPLPSLDTRSQRRNLQLNPVNSRARFIGLFRCELLLIAVCTAAEQRGSSGNHGLQAETHTQKLIPDSGLTD